MAGELAYRFRTALVKKISTHSHQVRAPLNA